MLPKLTKLRILDIGCGSGVPILELARLSGGEVIGLDVDQAALDELNKKIEAEGLSDRVKTMNCSMFDLDLPDKSFNLIWAKGSIGMMGFTRGLEEWRRFIKPNGFLVVHDEVGDLSKKIGQISDRDYKLLAHSILSRDIWWTEYYAHSQKLVDSIRKKFCASHELVSSIEPEQREIDMFKKNTNRFNSAFFVMQKGQN